MIRACSVRPDPSTERHCGYSALRRASPLRRPTRKVEKVKSSPHLLSLIGILSLLVTACSSEPDSTSPRDGADTATTENQSGTGGGAEVGAGAPGGSGDGASEGGTGATLNIPDGPVTLTIEEDAPGFCLVDGVIETTNDGYTGTGYANTDNSIDNSIEWRVNSKNGGDVNLEWRYAAEGSRSGDLGINDFNVESMDFEETGSWESWSTENATATLAPGLNIIRLRASTLEGLANIDSLTITGEALAPADCTDAPIVDSGPTDWGDGDIPQYITFLTAGSSDHNADLTIRRASGVKYYWATNFDDTSDYLTWSLNHESEDTYRVFGLLSTASEVPLTLSVDGTAHSRDVNTEDIGWQKLDMGTITIPAGESTLRLVRNSNSPNMEIKSLELIKESEVPAYEARVAAYKADMTWLREATFGVMFQFGAWGYPQSGDRKSINDGAADFDVESFADMIESTGARYVIWSLTWHQYWLQTPSSAVDEIMGNSSLTSERDLVGDVANELQSRGIRFMLYYHQGMQEEPEWKAKQDFPGEFDDTGSGDRTVFFNNWKAVISELGGRLGTNLDGWIFDDGTVYYPAHFEDLARAAREGNSNRFISYNNVGAARLTDFQDMSLGEREMSEASHYGAAPVGGDGIYTAGPLEGLYQHSMNPVDYWGIFEANQSVSTRISEGAAINAMTSAAERNVAISLGMVMWEDGTVVQSSLDVMRAAGAALD